MHPTPDVPSTHLSLLNDLRQQPLPEEAWNSFQARYEGTILHWCIQCGLQRASAEDVTQKILLSLYQHMPKHSHNPGRACFRTYLRVIVKRAVIDHRRYLRCRPDAMGAGDSRSADLLQSIEAPEIVDMLSSNLEELMSSTLGAALERVRNRVNEGLWQAFWQFTVLEVPVKEVALKLGKSKGAVYQDVYRVRTMLREELFPSSKEHSQDPGGASAPNQSICQQS